MLKLDCSFHEGSTGGCLLSSLLLLRTMYVRCLMDIGVFASLLFLFRMGGFLGFEVLRLSVRVWLFSLPL